MNPSKLSRVLHRYVREDGTLPKTRLPKCKAGFDCSWIACRFFSGFLLVFESEAVEAFTGFKRHGDLDREADRHALNFRNAWPSDRYFTKTLKNWDFPLDVGSAVNRISPPLPWNSSTAFHDRRSPVASTV